MATFRTLAAMRWSDMDALGHVHNARFMEYYEAARTELIHRLLAEATDWEGVGLVVRRNEVDYLVPLVYRPRPIAVDTWIERIGTTSMTLAYEAVEDDRSVIYGRARTVMVTVDAASGQPVPLPEPVRQLLHRYQESAGGPEAEGSVA